jgi:hypothetical protein
MSNAAGSGSGGRFPLDNLTYDIITVLHEKSKGLEAFDKYERDAHGNQQVAQLLQQIRQQDEQWVQQLQQQLGQLLNAQGGTASRQVGGSTTGSSTSR